MNKTLRISFSLKNTYRVNSILYSVKQIPLIKRALPDAIYGEWGFKIVANVFSVLWEVLSTFLGKFLYLLVTIVLAMELYPSAEEGQLFLHILVLLTVIGTFFNTYMFNPSKDKYYAMMLMRMDARAYALVNYAYAILKVLVGFAVFGILFGLQSNLPLWQCILIPFFVAGLKATVAAGNLLVYERTGVTTSESRLGTWSWILAAVLLAAAYGLPLAGVLIPGTVSVIFMVLSIVTGILSVHKIVRFKFYRQVYQEILVQFLQQMDTANHAVRDQSHKLISADSEITSKRKGFEYLNELFIKRHQKILWKSAKRITFVCAVLVLAVFVLFRFMPEAKEVVNGLLMTYLPYFVFIMYMINRGAGFTRALFINCDHSLLTYSFYKQPKFILKLYQIRLREIIKVNLMPASVIGTGMAILLWASGGTDNPLNYAVLIVSVLCMSIFFSVHYLTIYYLLQPFNAGTEIKSGTYQIVTSGTYLVCYFMMQVKLPTFMFGVATIAFCVLYCIISCILIYRMAPKTFKIRT